MHCHSL